MRTTVISLLLIIFSITMKAQDKGIEPVKNFDVKKYIGKWYEIARFDHSFEKGLENVSATYEFRDDGKISVFNRGIKNGEEKNITGKAKLKDNSGTGFLRVSFFWFFYADYIIFYLDQDYQYAVITTSKKYLWILSRQATLSEEIRDKLTGIARDKGFDTEKLIWVKQN